MGRSGRDGNPTSKKHNARRAPRDQLSHCASTIIVWSHVPGFTLTYNDFDYTGMVFRVEQSFSTKEVIRKNPNTGGPKLIQSASRVITLTGTTGVWRSMVGFDLLKSIPSFRYIPFLHHSFSEQAWFISGQWLMQNHWNNVANNFCQNVDKAGNQYSEEPGRRRIVAVGLRSYSTPSCQARPVEPSVSPWALATKGCSPAGWKPATRLSLSRAVNRHCCSRNGGGGTCWGTKMSNFQPEWPGTPGSNQGSSWSSLQHFSDRDQFWFEFTYYLL